MSALGPLHARVVDLSTGLDAPFNEESLAQGTNFTLRTDEGRFDLMSELSGLCDYRELLHDAVHIKLENADLRIASLNALIQIKEAGNYPKDRLELLELLAVRDRKLRAK